ncbi:MAG: hypothetical protein AAGI37_17945 [Planctomycetota bacterium]
MAVTVTRMWSPDSSGRDKDTRTASASWQVTGVSSSIAARTAVDAVTGATPDPINTVFTDRDGSIPDLFLLCEGLGEKTQGFELFIVTATYSVPPGGGSHNPEPDNPLDRPVEYSWEIGLNQENVEVDINGDAIQNAAGDPPEQPCSRDVHSVFLNVTRNEGSFDASTAIAATNRLNTGNFFGASEGQAKCVGIWSNKVTTADSVFWPVRYRFEFRADGFKKKLINRGFNFLNNGVLTRIVDGDEAGTLIEDAVRPTRPSVSRPRLLDANGGLLGANDQPVVLEFDVYESTDFSQFGLE